MHKLKEVLVLMHGCNMFHDFFYGKLEYFEMDQKPLVAIAKKKGGGLHWQSSKIEIIKVFCNVSYMV